MKRGRFLGIGEKKLLSLPAKAFFTSHTLIAMMKRILTAGFIALLSLIIPGRAAAQFRWAPVVGVDVNDLHFTQNLFDVRQSVGGTAGLMGELMFPGIGFGIDFSAMYNMMGARTDLGSKKVWSSDGIANPFVTVHALTIPVNLRFKWTRMNGFEDYLAPFVYGGPALDIMLAHNKIKANNGVPDPYTYSGATFSLQCGLGIELFRRFQIMAQHSWGMTTLLQTRKLDGLEAEGRQWTVKFAYLF